MRRRAVSALTAAVLVTSQTQGLDVLCFCQSTGWRQVWTSEAAARLHVNQSF